MKLGKTLYVKTGSTWRQWLEKNHLRAKEIWLVYYKKHSGKPRISYNDAVDEALCFGWIDSTVKGLDNERVAQRFTPRRKGSPMSELNKERVRRLLRKKKMTKVGMAHVSKLNSKFIIADDILKEIKKNIDAWIYFQKFPLGYKRIRIGYIESARSSQELFKKRLANFIKKTAKNKRFGMLQ